MDLIETIRRDLLERGLKKQAEIAAFVRAEIGWTMKQQVVSKVLRGKIKKPTESVHIMMLLVALGRDAMGERRIERTSEGSIRDTRGLDAVRFPETKRKEISDRIRRRIDTKKVSFAKVQHAIGVSSDDTYFLMEHATESLPVMVKLCSALGDQLDYIVHGLAAYRAHDLDEAIADPIAIAKERSKKVSAKTEG